MRKSLGSRPSRQSPAARSTRPKNAPSRAAGVSPTRRKCALRPDTSGKKKK